MCVVCVCVCACMVWVHVCVSVSVHVCVQGSEEKFIEWEWMGIISLYSIAVHT